MYEATKKDNLKVLGLDDQIGQVREEFDEMMRLRNEAKRLLELKFKDGERAEFLTCNNLCEPIGSSSIV